MMPNRSFSRWQRYIPVMVLLLGVLSLACGTSALVETGQAPMTESVLLPAPANQANSASAAPEPTAIPEMAKAASNELIFVTQREPESLSAWSEGCRGDVSSAICRDIANDPLTWIDSGTFEVLPLTGVEGWSQLTTHRWRFKLREGVTFHNGEAWNAEAAMKGLNYLGRPGDFGAWARIL